MHCLVVHIYQVAAGLKCMKYGSDITNITFSQRVFGQFIYNCWDKLFLYAVRDPRSALERRLRKFTYK